MTQLKRSLAIFTTTFLLSVISGSVLHNLFTSDRLQNLVVKILSDSAPGVVWTVHQAQVHLSDGLLPIVALGIGEVTGSRSDQCEQNVSINVRDVFLPLDMSSLIFGPVRLGNIRFHELTATEIPRLLQTCKGQSGSLVLKDGEVTLNNEAYQFKGIFEVSPTLLNGEVIPPFTVSGLYVDKRLDLEILWRESKIFAHYAIDEEALDIKSTKLPSVELLKVLKGLGVRPIPQNLGPNWIDISAHFFKKESDTLKVDEIAISGDLGDISAKDILITLDRKPTFSPFQITLKKVPIAEVAKVLEVESFPRFFKNPGVVSGQFNYDVTEHKFLGHIENVDIEFSRGGRKSAFKIGKSHLDLKYSGGTLEAYIKDFEIPNGKADGIIHAVIAKKNIHVGVSFQSLLLDPKILNDVISTKIGESFIDGQLDIVDSKVSALSIKSKINSIEGKGFKTSQVNADMVYNAISKGVLAFETSQILIDPKELDDEPSEIIQNIHKTISESRSWSNVKGQLTSVEGGARLRNVTFDSGTRRISVLPDKEDSVTVWDVRKKKALGKLSSRL